MWWLLRRLRLTAPLPISSDDAVELAKAECARQGCTWTWQERRPFIRETRTGYVIPYAYRSDPPSHFEIDGRSGAVRLLPGQASSGEGSIGRS